jgi:DNA-binding phage protein
VAKSRKISMDKLAGKLNLTRRGLYYALSKDGNPEWSTLSGLVNALGYRMQLKPKKAR